MRARTDDSVAGLENSGAIGMTAVLSEWLQLMLAEIARKRDDAERAREEQANRSREADTVRARDEDSKRL